MPEQKEVAARTPDEEIGFKPNALIPIWIKKTGIQALDQMAARPVLIDVKNLHSTISGQMLDLTLSGARVMPNEPFLIWKNVQVGVRFRYSNVIFTLCGLSKESNPDNSISFEFDDVSRKKMLFFAKEGLINPPAAQKSGESVAEPDSPKPLDPHKVRHLGAPGGVERRACHRYDLLVDATMTNLDTGLVINCQLLELSTSGCRIYTAQPNQLQKDTRVEVQFTGLGYPMRLPSTVQVKTGENLLGLKYFDLSYRIKTRLATLIFELAERDAT